MITGTVAAIGTFDGVHLGHRAIIARVIELARRNGSRSLVLTFANHPLSVIAPARCPLWATTRAISRQEIEHQGVDSVDALHFDAALAALTARQFFAEMRRRYGVSTLVMGYDNTFGSDRLTAPADYRAAGAAEGVDVVTVDAVETPRGVRASSSALRRAIAAGDTAAAADILSYPYTIEGPVVHGLQNGRKLGFPTLNIDITGLQPLLTGVYAATLLRGADRLPAVLNIGTNPTIADDRPLTCELHAIDTDLGQCYGQTVRFQVHQRIRGEQRFHSLDQLRAAIAADIAAASFLSAQ